EEHTNEHAAEDDRHSELDGWKREHIVANVASEDRVGDAEWRAIEELKQRPPLRCDGERDDHRHEQRSDERDRSNPSLDQSACRARRRRLFARRNEAGLWSSANA